MIRLTIVLFAFAFLLSAYIVFGPDPDAEPTPQVTRAEQTLPELPESPLLVVTPAAVAPFPGREIASLTETALNGLDPDASLNLQLPQVPASSVELQLALVQALSEGREERYIQAILASVQDNPAIRIPKTLATANGMVVIADLLPKPGPATLPPRPEFYTVAPGDSLASIAVAIYGSRDAYLAIFEANREILNSPDVLRPGQRLALPDF